MGLVDTCPHSRIARATRAMDDCRTLRPFCFRAGGCRGGGRWRLETDAHAALSEEALLRGW